LLSIAIRQVKLYDLAQQEIAERKLAEEALRQQTLELEARNAELDAYAHTVAHDLKTPLASLLGFSRLLEKRYTQTPPKKLKETLGYITESARRMTEIINELLLLASVRKMEEIPFSAVDMTDIVTRVQQRLKAMLENNQAQIVVPDHWLIAQGYGPWLEEVWVNYISNAIKYGGTPPNIKLGATELPDGRIRFWVRDNGMGLTQQQQTELFSTFTRLDIERAEGHGLGLSIVQRIMKKLNGEVGLRSELGKGSEFYFILPGVEDKDYTPVPPNKKGK
jgi:signal transduction histidine kinase